MTYAEQNDLALRLAQGAVQGFMSVLRDLDNRDAEAVANMILAALIVHTLRASTNITTPAVINAAMAHNGVPYRITHATKGTH